MAGNADVLWDMSVDLLAIANQDGYFTRVSPSWQRVLGHSMETLLSRPYIEFVHPDDVASTLQAAAGLQEPGAVTIGFECRYRTANGEYRWLEWSVRVTEDTRELYCIARDVTELKEAEQDLRESAAYTRRLIEATLDPLVTISPSGLIMDVNHATERATGRDRTELIGTDFADYFTDPEAARTGYQRAFATGHMTDYPLAIRHVSGSVMSVLYNAAVYRDEHGAVAGVFAAARDISELTRTREALAQESQFRLAMEYSASGMCLVEPTGGFLAVNSALCQMLGRSESELLQCTWQDVTHPEDLDLDTRFVESVVLGQRDSYRMVKRYVDLSGDVVWGELSVGAVREADGALRYLVGQIVDVTDRVVAEQALADRENLLAVVLDNSPQGVMRFDRDLRVEFVNRRIAEISGVPAAQWLGRTFAEVGYPPETAEEWDAHSRRVLETGMPVRYEFEADNTEGHRWYEAIALPEFGPSGEVEHVVSSTWDTTDRKVADVELLRLASSDVLTGLANRTVLESEIGRALSSGRRQAKATAVLMVDLDRFKIVNDSLGHGFGDSLLKAAADRLTATVRGSDLVARLGGDEFIVVMRDLSDAAEAIQAAWRLVRAFREPFFVEGAELFSTASCGVAVAGAGADANPDDLIREADTALYIAKGEGRDRVAVFNDELRAVVTSRLVIEGELRHALSRGQFAVWYQPEVDLVTGAIRAAEGLLRWHHPDGTIYPAGRFIEVAEETGLILDIGDWVLGEVFRQAAQWSTGKWAHVELRFNLSTIQLAEAGLLEAVDRALAESGANPGALCAEITETALLQETAIARDNLEGLRDRGLRIAVDDFGTGYASLAYLREFPVDVLKIDRSFVTGLNGSDQSSRLVGGIVALARTLGMDVTAEGVEHRDQAAALRAVECPSAQGFLFSPAVPGGQMTELLGRTFAV